jgi:hypothetical protein
LRRILRFGRETLPLNPEKREGKARHQGFTRKAKNREKPMRLRGTYVLFGLGADP